MIVCVLFDIRCELCRRLFVFWQVSYFTFLPFHQASSPLFTCRKPFFKRSFLRCHPPNSTKTVLFYYLTFCTHFLFVPAMSRTVAVQCIPSGEHSTPPPVFCFSPFFWGHIASRPSLSLSFCVFQEHQEWCLELVLLPVKKPWTLAMPCCHYKEGWKGLLCVPLLD